MSNEIKDQIFNDFVNSDEQALTHIINLYQRKIEAFATRITKNREQAQEITQDAIMNLWENRSKIESPEALKSYLFRSAYNASLNYIKHLNHQTKYIEQESLLADFTTEIESNHDADVMFLRLESAIAKLPEQRKKVFALSRIDDRSVQEIAKTLDISTITVRRHIDLALAELKHIFVLALLFFKI